MPPLYRMPIVYVVVVLAGGLGWFLFGGHREARSSAAAVSRVPETKEAPAPKAAAKVAEPLPPPNDGILRTPEGLRRKVLVKDLDLVVHSQPEGGRAVGSPLEYYSIHYVFGVEPSATPRAFQIGPRTGPPAGWVPAGSVLEWDTRLMARPTPRGDRPPLVIYREQSCLLDALAGRACATHGVRCPVEGEEAVGVAQPGSSPAAGLPILRSVSIPQPDGPARTVFEVASLVQDQAPTRPPEQPLAADLPALKRIYVAFAIDTTASMQASIDAARTMAEQLVAEASRSYADVTLRLALVEYRDESPVYGFRNRVVTEFTDPDGFRQALGQIAAAKHGDGSVDEMVLDGVATALPKPAEEPFGRVRHLDWPTGRAGELATKLLVLLGDAPDHARDLDRAGAGRAGEGLGHHDCGGGDCPVGPLARRTGPLRGPVAHPGRGLVSPARPGAQLFRAD